MLTRDPLYHILSLLEINDLKSLSCTSKFFGEFILKEDLWRSVYAQTWNCDLAKLDRTTDWKKECFKRVKKHKSFDVSRIGKQLLSLDKNEKNATKKMESISNKILHERDLLQFNERCVDEKMPRWLIDGTYFKTKSFHEFTYGHDDSSEECKIMWDLYTPSGVCVSFIFEYEYLPFRESYLNAKITFRKSNTWNVLINVIGL